MDEEQEKKNNRKKTPPPLEITCIIAMACNLEETPNIFLVFEEVMLFALSNTSTLMRKSCVHFTHGDRFRAEENKAAQLARNCVQTQCM